MTVPPRPQQGPSSADQVRAFASRQADQPFTATTRRQTNKTKVGGGFNLNVNVTDKGVPMSPGHGPAGQGGTGTPGADFMSNEDIRAFSEHLRKEARNRAVERSMDAAQLEARLRNIPDAAGRMHGARARARRVTRYLKLIAAGEKAIAKWSTALYSAFEREFEAELIKIGKGRNTPPANSRFTWR
ncbi:plasmid transfer protein TraA [Streptomyces viridodiastaticus]|uniref:plasmid transfer protein TraA n=1 Tax=Streptomyces albogriseolus TaxID=1887 RepID=UPI00225B4D27|nr:plasmid transfer protein TraA [Streptomyces viridodiastaticus]MCX4571623.1 plasmid transfer protein TraA [Streptomyces viridodiastaticus]